MELAIVSNEQKNGAGFMESAQRFIAGSLELPADKIHWGKLEFKQSWFSVLTMKGKGETSFTSRENGFSINSYYDAREETPIFSNLTINDFVPLDNGIRLQRMFRFDYKGGIHLLARTLSGDLKRNAGQFIMMGSGTNAVKALGVEIPHGITSMLEEDRKELLLNQVHKVLIAYGLMTASPVASQLDSGVIQIESGKE